MTRVRLALILAFAILVQACAATTQLSAGNDIHAFLLSIRNDDQASFDAHVDRAALKAQLRAKLIVDASRKSDDLGALAAIVGRPLVDFAVDNLVQPEVFRAAAAEFGYSPDRPIPNSLVIAQALRPIDAAHVCAVKTRDGPCIFDFADEGGVWRLTGFEGDRGLLSRPGRL
jgi:Protein of unknown function (DUF2939)